MSSGNGTVAGVQAALATVLDPELDLPITELEFVGSATVSDEGVVRVELRLPTFYCAPNFAYLMVADAHDAVSAVPGVSRAEIVLEGHHDADQINGGVAAGSGFVGTFEGQATEELGELRRQFLTKAALAGQDRVARPLVDAGATPADLARTTLGEVEESIELTRLRERRGRLGLPAGDDAPLLVTAEGGPVPEPQIPLHLRRARLARTGIDLNGEYCKGLLAARYPRERNPA